MIKIIKRIPAWLCLLVLSVTSIPAFAQDTLSVMTYNVLNFSENDSDRSPYFHTVIENTTPDILVIQEIMSQQAFQVFGSQVLGSDYEAGDFIDGDDSDNGIFYKPDLLRFISNRAIATDLRDISEFSLIYRSTGDTIRIYSVHLKASSGGGNESQRLQEVQTLRSVTDQLPPGSLFMVCGDFNIYGSWEPAYEELTYDNGNTDGHFIDPINISGTWNNAAYAAWHTQSTRTRQFGGGASGGLDDRFDMLLYSQGIADGQHMAYIPNSTVAFGNDGQHYNDSINRPPNATVSQTVADALHYASDHLPVMARFEMYTSTVTFGINLKPGWNAVSSYIQPQEKLFQNIFHPFGDDFELLMGEDGIFYPDGGIQTISNWDYKNGYLIKVDKELQLELIGLRPADYMLEIHTGWNLIPVLTDQYVLTEEVFAAHLNDVIVIREATGTHLFWPEKGINTLPYLSPGSAYYLKSRSDFEVGF